MYLRQFFITLFTPLARGMSSVHPNTLTLISLILGLSAGITYGLTHLSHLFFITGAFFVALSGAADCLDGIVARMYHRTSKVGDFLDHFYDRLVDIAIFLGLAFSGRAHVIFALIVIIIHSINIYLWARIETIFSIRISGLGKPECFVILIIFSIGMTLYPDTSLKLESLSVTPIDLLFAFYGIYIICRITLRLFHVYKRYGQKDKKHPCA